MKNEYDFSNAERGKFLRKGARVVPPVHLEPDVLDHLAGLASARGVSSCVGSAECMQGKPAKAK